MKIVVFFILNLLAGFTWAENYSVGLFLGTPIAVTGQYKLDETHSVDAGFGWAVATYPGNKLYADYLWMLPQQLAAGDADLDIYVGFGGSITAIQAGDDKGLVAIAPRAPLGIKYILADSPTEIFGEIAPMLNISPATNLAFDIGLGIRYLF